VNLLTVNAGSSSARLDLFSNGARLARARYGGSADETARLREFLAPHAGLRIDAAAHRVVHGGTRLVAPCRVDAGIEAEIGRLEPLAPLHNRAALAWMEACRGVLGADLVQVAAFDTAYYAGLPAVSRAYALPRALAEAHGLHRYGFHGLAHEAMWRAYGARRPERAAAARVISLQLGGGCSITAQRAGRALDTSMGFSPLEGLVMATRSGDLDPGLLVYLQECLALAPAAAAELLNRESGLLGLAGEADMERLLARDDAAARFALDQYCYRARKYIGAYYVVLGGLDAILFGGGVGEHAPAVRARILAGLAPLGVALDSGANAAAVEGEARIDAAQGGVEVWVTSVDEAALLAQAASSVLDAAPDAS